MKFNFVVDKACVALNIIEKKLISAELASFLMEKYPQEYAQIMEHRFYYDKDLYNYAIIQETINSEEFEPFFTKCQLDSERIQTNLKEYQQRIEEFLNKLCKMELPNYELTALIVPWGGVSFQHNKSFIWGHEKGSKDKFYDLVYIYHEALHQIFKLGDVSHCIIEQLSDCRLAKFLNPELKQGYKGHKKLLTLHSELDEIFKVFFGEIKSEKYNNKKFRKMNILEFEEYLLVHYRQAEVSKLNLN